MDVLVESLWSVVDVVGLKFGGYLLFCFVFMDFLLLIRSFLILTLHIAF